MSFDETIDDLKDEMRRERSVNDDLRRRNALLYPSPRRTTWQFAALIVGILVLGLLAPYLP